MSSAVKIVPSAKVDTIDLVKASDITPEPISWIWEGWLATGKMHIIGGAPGAGKTTICLSLAATLSSGGVWPDGSKAEAGNVVIWSGEDDPKDTLVPRLMASGADCTRVHFINGILDGNERRMFDPARDIEPLRRKLAEIGNIRLLIIDPIVSAISGDSHKNAEVRKGLQPLVDLTDSSRCALLGVTHFSKNTRGSDPVERITGSIAFAAQARIVLVVGKRENEDESSEHVLCRAKSNIGLDSGGFVYEIQQSALEQYPKIFASTVQWGEAIEGTAQEILTETKESTEEKSSALQDAKDYLVKILSDGELPWEEISQGARQFSIADRTLKRAKSALGIRHRKIGKRSHWFLPEQVNQTDSTDPAENLAQLAHLKECPANAVSQTTEPTVPTKPTGNLEQLKAQRASNIAKNLNRIVAKGIKELSVRP